MPRNATQVIFECSEVFRRRLNEEKLKRGISVKAMIIKALGEYWQWPADRKEAQVITLELNPYDTPGQRHWAEMFVKYMERCPPAKVKLLQSVIREDLKVHRSKRISARRKEREKRNETPRAR